MKVFLLNTNNDFNLHQALLWNTEFLKQDLGLATLFEAMARGNDFVLEISEKAILSKDISGKDTTLYRQQILNDCLQNQAVIRDIFKLANEAIENEKNNRWGYIRYYPNSVLFRSVEVIEMFISMLRKLRGIADGNADKFNSRGFGRFFEMIKEELNEAYFQKLENHLEKLRFRDGVLMSANLGKGNKGINYVLRKLEPVKITWWQRFLSFLFRNFMVTGPVEVENGLNGMPVSYTFFINSRDESGIRSLMELKDEGINLVANSLAQSDEHILNFFKNLRIEMAFYIGCINLYETLRSLNEPVCIPELVDCETRYLHFKGLYDICLPLITGRKVTGNDLNTLEKRLIVITVANQG